MFKLAFNSTTLRNIDVFTSLRHIKDYGYDGVELTLNDTHLHPLQHSFKRCMDVRNFCTDNGIDIVCVAAGGPNALGDVAYEPSLITPDATERGKRTDFIKAAIELTHYLGAPVLNINSGKPRTDISDDKAYDLLKTEVNNLLPDVGDITLVLEPEPDFLIGTTTTAIPLIQEIDSPKFRLNLDIGHVFCCETDCYNNIEKALPFSRHIHIEDIKGGIHHHEIPGEGDIDFSRIVDIIKASGYAHYVSVELHHHDSMWQRALKESRDYLLKLM